jgi:hypothetical protein
VPRPVAATDPRFGAVLDYVRWTSDQFPTQFRVEGDEVVIDGVRPGVAAGVSVIDSQ